VLRTPIELRGEGFTTVGDLVVSAGQAFMETHADLLEAAWWQAAQRKLASDEVPEVLSYPDSMRFPSAQDVPASTASRHKSAAAVRANDY
jgi:isocitrate dehydrogenase kinase/phosphatase